MSTLATSWVRVDALTSEYRVRYHGRTWSVLDVIAVAEPLSGTGVLGLDRLTGERRILLYSNPSSVAEVVAHV